MPLAAGFVVWITGLISSVVAYRKARRFFHQSRYVVAGICAVLAVAAVWFSLAITSDSSATADLCRMIRLTAR